MDEILNNLSNQEEMIYGSAITTPSNYGVGTCVLFYTTTGFKVYSTSEVYNYSGNTGMFPLGICTAKDSTSGTFLSIWDVGKGKAGNWCLGPANCGLFVSYNEYSAMITSLASSWSSINGASHIGISRAAASDYEPLYNISNIGLSVYTGGSATVQTGTTLFSHLPYVTQTPYVEWLPPNLSMYRTNASHPSYDYYNNLALPLCAKIKFTYTP